MKTYGRTLYIGIGSCVPAYKRGQAQYRFHTHSGCVDMIEIRSLLEICGLRQLTHLDFGQVTDC